MTPLDLITSGIKLYGRKYWKTKLADALGVDVSTIHRMTHRNEVPGPYAIAIASLLEHKRHQDEIDRAARKLLPRRLRRKKPKKKTRKYVRKLIPYAGAEME